MHSRQSIDELSKRAVVGIAEFVVFGKQSKYSGQGNGKMGKRESGEERKRMQ
jgi:hypothetical protein